MKNKIAVTLMIGLLSVGVANAVGFDPRFGDDSSDVPAPQFNANQYRISQGMAIAQFPKPQVPSINFSGLMTTRGVYLQNGSFLNPEGIESKGGLYFRNPTIKFTYSTFSPEGVNLTSVVRIENTSNKDLLLTDVVNFNLDISNYGISDINLLWVSSRPNSTNGLLAPTGYPIIFYEAYHPSINQKYNPYAENYRIIPAGSYRDIGIVYHYKIDPADYQRISNSGNNFIPQGTFNADFVFSDGSVTKVSSRIVQ